MSRQHLTRLNPDQLHETPGYHHITFVQAGPTAYLSGQCPLDRAGELVGPASPEAQTDQVIANSLIALQAAGATPADVVRSVVYVRSDDSAVLATVWHRIADSTLGPALTSASTLLGVAQLGFPGQLVELDLTVSLPAAPAGEG